MKVQRRTSNMPTVSVRPIRVDGPETGPAGDLDGRPPGFRWPSEVERTDPLGHIQLQLDERDPEEQELHV